MMEWEEFERIEEQAFHEVRGFVRSRDVRALCHYVRSLKLVVDLKPGAPRFIPYLPWRRPELEGWLIVGMNHYSLEGELHMFVAMTKGDRCIVAEGIDGPGVWDELAKKASGV